MGTAEELQSRYASLDEADQNDMRQLIYDGSSQNKIKDLAIKNGMTSLRNAGIEKIKTGITTIEEVLRATVEDN